MLAAPAYDYIQIGLVIRLLMHIEKTNPVSFAKRHLDMLEKGVHGELVIRYA